MEIKISGKKEHENNREYVYRVLRDNIMTLKLLPGATVNEGELAELFHISRTPVHEAVLILKEESLIDVYPQSGSRISYIQIDILKEGYFMRSVLEPEILRMLEGSLSSGRLEPLRENLGQQKKALEEKGEERIDLFFKLDDEFHHRIYELAGKKNTWYAVKKVSTHYDRVRYLDAIMNHRELEKIYEEHRKIFDILLLGLTPDFELRVFYDRHLGSYREGFQEILERYQGYFESKE